MTYAKKEPTGTEQPTQPRDNSKIYIGSLGAVGWAAFAACMISHCGRETAPVVPTPSPTAYVAVATPIPSPQAAYTVAPVYTPTAKAGTVKKVKSKKTKSSLESKLTGVKTPVVQSPVEEEEEGLKKPKTGEEP